MFIYGGTTGSSSTSLNFKNQILELDCKTKQLEQRTKLRFDFEQGSCASNNVDILLCFAKNDRKQCHKSTVPAPKNWWESFTQTNDSSFAHAETAFAMSSGEFKY